MQMKNLISNLLYPLRSSSNSFMGLENIWAQNSYSELFCIILKLK